MGQGYAEIFGAMSCDAWLQFNGTEIKGYLAQHIEELRKKK